MHKRDWVPPSDTKKPSSKEKSDIIERYQESNHLDEIDAEIRRAIAPRSPIELSTANPFSQDNRSYITLCDLSAPQQDATTLEFATGEMIHVIEFQSNGKLSFSLENRCTC